MFMRVLPDVYPMPVPLYRLEKTITGLDDYKVAATETCGVAAYGVCNKITSRIECKDKNTPIILPTLVCGPTLSSAPRLRKTIEETIEEELLSARGDSTVDDADDADAVENLAEFKRQEHKEKEYKLIHSMNHLKRQAGTTLFHFLFNYVPGRASVVNKIILSATIVDERSNDEHKFITVHLPKLSLDLHIFYQDMASREIKSAVASVEEQAREQAMNIYKSWPSSTLAQIEEAWLASKGTKGSKGSKSTSSDNIVACDVTGATSVSNLIALLSRLLTIIAENLPKSQEDNSHYYYY